MWETSQIAIAQETKSQSDVDLRLQTLKTLKGLAEEASLESPDAIPVEIQVRLGEVTMPVAELLQLQTGSVVTLEQSVNQPVEILAAGKVVALGEIVAVEDQLGVRVLKVADAES